MARWNGDLSRDPAFSGAVPADFPPVPDTDGLRPSAVERDEDQQNFFVDRRIFTTALQVVAAILESRCPVRFLRRHGAGKGQGASERDLSQGLSQGGRRVG